ncbi:MAG: hypothetical protein ACHQ7M_12060, partial [Chloroflexota bacterium]
MTTDRPSRRDFLRLTGLTAGVLSLGGLLQACGGSAATPSISAPASSAPPAGKPATSAGSASAKPVASG